MPADSVVGRTRGDRVPRPFPRLDARRKLQRISAILMGKPTNVVSIHPYFKVKPGKLAEARAMLRQFIAKSSHEELLLQYDFTINGDMIHCRESYRGAAGLEAHLKNVGPVLDEFVKLVEIARLEVHGPAAELAKLKPGLAGLNPTWFELECGVTD